MDKRIARLSYQDASGCFAAVSRDEWPVLGKRQQDQALLAKIAEVRPVSPDEAHAEVTVAGDLRDVDPTRWQEILRGIVRAQEIHDDPVAVDFTYSDIGTESSERHATLLTRYVTTSPSAYQHGSAVTLDGTRSTVFDQDSGGPWPVIGLRDPDVRSLAPEFASAKINEFLGPSISARVRPADGISDEECGFLRRYSYEPNMAMNLDLRGVDPSLELLTRLGGCGYARVVVDEQYAGHVRAMRERPATVDVLFVEDGSAGITTDCAARLNTPTEMSTCVAVLTAAEDGRVRLKLVE